ncbi:MAG: choice-of-anchor D domain-containing protein [Candidatus Kapaibacterium sp.]
MHTSVRTNSLLRRWLAPALLALAVAAPLSAQQARQVIISVADRKIKANESHLMATAQIIPLSIDLNRLAASTGPVLKLSAVPIAPGMNVDLDLDEFSVLYPGATVMAGNKYGEAPIQITSRFFRGKIAGDEQSEVYLAIGRTSVIGSVIKGGKSYEITTDWNTASAHGTLAAIAYPLADIVMSPGRCGVNQENAARLGLTPERIAEGDRMVQEKMAEEKSARGNKLESVVKGQRLILGQYEGDYEFSKLFNGNATAAADYITQTIGRVSNIFERDVNLQVAINALKIWTTNDDPYTIAPPQALELALHEVKAAWSSHSIPVRHFTQVFSGKPWTTPIGLSYVQVLCFQPLNYSLCAMTKTNPEQDVLNAAHETGHIIGAFHTNDCNEGAVDHCAAAEEARRGNTTCFPPTDIHDELGTIMSLCKQRELKFHPASISHMDTLIAAATCVQSARQLNVRSLTIFFSGADLGHSIDTTIPGYLYNRTEEVLTVKTFKLSGANASQFQIISPDTSAPFTIAPGASVDLHMKYLATTKNSSAATITITHNANNPTIKVAVEAYALDKQPQILIRTSGTGVDFRTQKVGQFVDTTLTDVFQNAGFADLHVTDVRIVGPDAGDFQLLAGTAPFDIPFGSGTFVTARIKFEPATAGDKLAYLKVISNSPGKGDSVKLIAKVKTGPRLVLSTPNLSIDFRAHAPLEQVDTTIKAFFFNSGTDSMNVIVDLIGKDASSFTTPEFFFDMAPQATQDFHLTFAEAATGQKEADLILNHVDPVSSQIYHRDTVHLLGEIVGPVSVPGVTEAASGFTISPNPTSGDATIFIAPLEQERGLKYSLTISDALGRQVYEHGDRFSTDGASIVLKTTGWATGRYFLKLTSNGGTRSQTLTIQR